MHACYGVKVFTCLKPTHLKAKTEPELPELMMGYEWHRSRSNRKNKIHWNRSCKWICEIADGSIESGVLCTDCQRSFEQQTLEKTYEILGKAGK